MSVQVATVTGAANNTSSVLSLPMSRQNFQGMGGSLLVNFANGAASGTVSVQVSSDPNANPNLTPAQQATALWNNHDILFSLTAAANSSIVYPVPYIRLIVNATLTGTVTLFMAVPDGSNS